MRRSARWSRVTSHSLVPTRISRADRELFLSKGKCLHLSGLTPEPLTADDDYKLLRLGIGFTNMVARATKGSADLTRKEIKEGSLILLEKLKKYKPKIAVFNGKLIYEVFSGKKEFGFGRQPQLLEGTSTYMWVMPSSSARCAQLPRAADKVPYYAALKKFRDYLNGTITHLDESDIVFADTKLKKREHEGGLGGGLLGGEDKKGQLGGVTAAYEDYDGEGLFVDGVIVKQEPGLIPGKKKRGRPKKIKNPEELPPADVEKCDANGEMIKKRRGRPKKIHQQQKQAEREAKEREYQAAAAAAAAVQQQQQHHHQMGGVIPGGPMSDGYGGMASCFSSQMMSPPKPFSHMAPYPQQSMSEQQQQQAYYGGGNAGMADSPYNKQSPVHSLQHYSQSPKSLSMSYSHSDLSSEINTAMSSDNNMGEPSPLTSPGVQGGAGSGNPGMEHSDFDAAAMQQQQQSQYNPDHGSPAGSTPSHPAYGGYMGYHDQQQQQQQQQQQDQHQQQQQHQGAPTPMSQSDEHSRHSHPTPPHSHQQQHTPTHSMSPHPHEQYGIKRSSGQDVASKSLSDLESLVDQIPSIAESGGQRLSHGGHMGGGGGGDESLQDKLDSSMHQQQQQQQYMSAYQSSIGGGQQTNYSPPLSTQTSIYGSSDGGYSSPAYGMAGRQQQQQQQQQQPEQQQQQHSKSYTVENLASSNYTPSNSMSHQQQQQQHHQYSNVIPGPHYPVPMSAASSNNGYLFGGLESSLMQRGYPAMPPSHHHPHHHPSLHGHHPMGNPYGYQSSPYASSFDAYSSAPSPGTIHAPQPTYQGYGAVSSPDVAATSSTPPTYLQQQTSSRPPVDLAGYDGV
ncbi:hypothetical protein TKK_0000524 [Trichogramma kaykai]